MRGGLDSKENVFAAANVNDFGIEGERVLLAVVAFVVAVAVEFFDVEILRVAVERGESPGDVIIVAGDDEREAGKCDACGVEAGRVQVSHVPGVGLAEGEMHIVCEEWLAGSGVRAGDDPVVGAGGAACAGGLAEEREERVGVEGFWIRG